MSGPVEPVEHDPFGTAALREATLATWRRDPSRLRQDANLEEDHARGSYRDRVVVELAQNAADAGNAAGPSAGPGQLLLCLTTTPEGGELLAANTGAPLTADGVAALASLRASAKHTQDTVGRFGVGFSAVRSVSDEIRVATRTPGGAAGIAFSLARTRAALDDAARDLPALADEAVRRHGDLPALRLPFPDERPDVPDGFTTAVRLTLRGTAERDAIHDALAAADDVLLLALPALGAVRIEVDDAPSRTISDVTARWRSVRADGTLTAELLADRPVEDRERTGWSLTWALPFGQPALAGAPPPEQRLVHAPTPTDDPSTLPALLIATFPLDPTRRRVATGPVTDYLVARAGDAYADLAARLTTGRAGSAGAGDPLALVPTALPAGALDGALHAAALAALQRTELLTEVGTGELIPARAAQAITGPVGQDEQVLAALAPMVGGLVHIPTGRTAQARTLGVALRELADIVQTLPTTGDADTWRALYATLAPHAAAHREALAGLPVPLHDGDTFAHGPRGLRLPTPEFGVLPVHLPGLRIVHPRAAHPALVTLGALEADAVTLLEQPAVQAAVEGEVASDAVTPAGAEAAESGPAGVSSIVAGVLDLVRQAVEVRGEDVVLPDWLADLPLPAANGESARAADLAAPGSWAAEVLDALDPVHPALVEHWGESALRAAGVRADLVTTVVRDVVAEPAAADDVALEGWEDYLAHLADLLGSGAWVGDVAVVADLDAVTDGTAGVWPRLLTRIAQDPGAREALLTKARATSGGAGAVTTAPSYTAWWLREELGAPFAHPRATGRVPFVPAAPDGTETLDDAVLAAVGAVGDLADLDPAEWDGYLDHWPDDGALAMADALALWRGLARAAATGARLTPPDSVPALADGAAGMAPADDVVVGTPMWAQVRAVLPAPQHLVEAVADLLDLDVAEDCEPQVTGERLTPTPPGALVIVPAAPGEWVECDEVTVAGRPVEWWVSARTAWATTTTGLARALAHAAGDWSLRHRLEDVLTDPQSVDDVLAESAGDDA
ncbi:hypothetical protein GCM10023169_00990 [Georgenia halophila]|uniref:ATP-binding protein n=1 Tax=Georgenia halophila TaxID=620889 RepID=A0ABP8KTQ2_9MICO